METRRDNLETPFATETPARCLARIAALQRRWFLLRRLDGVSRLVAIVSFCLMVVIVLDATWRGGHASRAVLLLACVAGVSWLGGRYLMPLFDRLSRDAAALLFERGYPELNGRLITAVQLANPAAREQAGASAGLCNRVQAAAERAAEQLDAARIVPGRPSLRHALVLWLAVGALGVVVGLNQEAAGIGLGRVLMPWARIDWPKRTQLELNVTQPVRVVRGGTLTIEGRASRHIPATGTLHVQSGAGAADRARFEIAAEGAFTVQYRPVNSNLTVWVEAGDAASEKVAVRMVPPPEVLAIQGECVYPAYTHLPPQRRDDGNVQAVFGSQVRLQINTNKPVATATLAWDGQAAAKMELMPPDRAEARFQVQASRSYAIELVDELGFRNAEPVAYRIEMIENQYPQVERSTPATDKRVTPNAVVPITAELTDDFGVTEVDLCCHAGRQDQVQRINIPLDQPGKRVEVRHLWPLEPMKLKPGQSVTYWLEVRDAGEHATKHDWPVSRARQLRVLDEPELARLLGEQMEQILDDLTELETLQGECTDSVTRIGQSLGGPATQPASPETAQEHTKAEKWRQDHLARTAGRLADQLQRVAEDYTISRIGQPERAERLAQTAERLSKIAGVNMPGIVLSLDEALTSLRGLVAPTAPTTQPGEGR